MANTTPQFIKMVGSALSATANTEVKITLGNGTGGATTGLVMGSGLASDRTTTADADSSFIDFRWENSATSGDNRGIYNRLYLTGAGSGGESLRSYTDVEDVACGTAHGAHLTLGLGTSGSITGLGAASRSTLMIPNAALTGGTYCGGMSELYFEGASSDISGTTAHSIHRFVCGGNATGAATAYNAFEFADIPTGTDATDMLDTDQHAAAATDGLRCLINGAAYCFMMVRL